MKMKVSFFDILISFLRPWLQAVYLYFVYYNYGFRKEIDVLG